jgi:uncharacterized protein YdeI (YjbR/CyaY-like superfamily)
VVAKKTKRKATGTKKPATAKKKAKSKTIPSPIRAFRSQAEFEGWLEKNYDSPDGIWIRFARKGSGIESVSHPEALDSALCFGWIDALRLPETEKTYLHRFLPRRTKSLWSKINREKALSLIESGRMRPAGLAEIERAKSDGRWDAAYDSPANAKMPADFQRELDRNPKAKAFFETISRVNRYAIIWRLVTAKKQETRDKLARKFLDMLERGETIH